MPIFVLSFAASCCKIMVCLQEINPGENIGTTNLLKSNKTSPVSCLMGWDLHRVEMQSDRRSGQQNSSLKITKPVCLTESIVIMASELSFILQITSSYFEFEDLSGSFQTESNTKNGSTRQHFDNYSLGVNIQNLSGIYNKLLKIPHLFDDKIISPDILCSREAILAKRRLVYLLPSSASASAEVLSSKNRRLSSTIENSIISDGFGYSNSYKKVESAVSEERPTLLLASSKNTPPVVEEMTSLSWIIGAARATLSHLYSEDGSSSAYSDSQLSSTYIMWKEIVDLMQSLLEREDIIKQTLSDVKRLDEYLKLCKLYGSEIGLRLERAKVYREFSTNVQFKKAPDEEYYTHSIARLVTEQTELEIRQSVKAKSLLKNDSVESDLSTRQDNSNVAVESGVSALTNPLKVLLQSVFPVSELRAAADVSSITFEQKNTFQNTHTSFRNSKSKNKNNSSYGRD